MNREPEITLDAIRKAANVAATLRQRFVRTTQQSAILNKLLLLHEERNALAAMGTLTKIDGMALLAPTGSGKTRTLEWVFTELKRMMSTGADHRHDLRVVSVRMPTPATLKTAAEAVMKEVGYPVSLRATTETNATDRWTQLRSILKELRVTVLHFDEAQDIWGNANKPQRKSVINTLKSLSQNKEWPFIVVLSGTEELKEMVNQDAQLGRRLKPTELLPLKKSTDARTIRSVISTYAEEAGLTGFEQLDAHFLDRFLIACSNRLGIAIDLIIGAIQQAVLLGDTHMTDRHFAKGFTHITECDAAMNPFISADWQKINASILFARLEDSEAEPPDNRRSPRLRRSG